MRSRTRFNGSKWESVRSDKSKLNRYISDINKYDLLTAEDEVRLAKLIKEWDNQAFEAMVNANLRYVITVANGYATDADTLQDLVSAWNAGLIEWVKRFDYMKWFRLISYADRWIRQSMFEYFQRDWIVYVPWTQNKSKIKKFTEGYYNRHWCDPSYEVIVEGCDLTIDVVKNILQAKKKSSVDAPSEDGQTLLDTISHEWAEQVEGALTMSSDRKYILDLLNSWILSERQAEIIKLKYWFKWKWDMNYIEIWELLGLSHEAIRLSHDRAIQKLRRKKNVKEIENLFDS